MNISMPEKSRASRFRPLIFVLAILLAAIIAAVIWHITGRVSFDGQARESTLSLSPGVAGTIHRIETREGQTVLAGQPLLSLDPAPYRRILEQEQRNLADLEALVPPAHLRLPSEQKNGQRDETLEERLARQRLEEDDAEQSLREASAREAQASITYNRASAMASSGKLPFADRDAAERAQEEARRALRAARTQFESLSLARAATGTDLKRARSGQNEAGVDPVQARLQVKNYEQQRERTKIAAANVEATILTAPADGIVTGLVVSPGETVTPGHPCLFLAPLNQPVTIIAHVSEDVAGRLTKGQRCIVDIAAARNSPFDGWVSAVFPRTKPLNANATEKDAFAGARMQVQVTLLQKKDAEKTNTEPSQPLLLPEGATAKVTVLLRAPLYATADPNATPQTGSAAAPDSAPSQPPATPQDIHQNGSRQENAPSVPVPQRPEAPDLPSVPVLADPPASTLPQSLPTPEAQPAPTPEAQPAPTPEAQPAPTPEAQPAPTPEAQPAPTPEAQPAPTPEAQPAPTPEAQPAPTPAGQQETNTPSFTPQPIPQAPAAPQGANTLNAPPSSDNSGKKSGERVLPALPPMKAPARLIGSPLPDPGNNPSLATPETLDADPSLTTKK